MIVGHKFRVLFWWIVVVVLGVMALPGLIDPSAQNLMNAGAWLFFSTGVMLGTLMDRFAIGRRVILSIAVMCAFCSALLVFFAWWLGLTAAPTPLPIMTVPVVLFAILAIALILNLIEGYRAGKQADKTS